jgi:hypothetical protein
LAALVLLSPLSSLSSRSPLSPLSPLPLSPLFNPVTCDEFVELACHEMRMKRKKISHSFFQIKLVLLCVAVQDNIGSIVDAIEKLLSRVYDLGEVCEFIEKFELEIGK